MNKKGFTLVELLAVIVILAIIALIAIPLIGNVIEKAKIGALESSVNGLVESANMYYANNTIKGETVTETIFDFEDGEQVSDKKLEYKGKVYNGKLILHANGEVAVCIDDEEHYAYKNKDTDEIVSGIGTCLYDGTTGDFSSNSSINDLRGKTVVATVIKESDDGLNAIIKIPEEGHYDENSAITVPIEIIKNEVSNFKEYFLLDNQVQDANIKYMYQLEFVPSRVMILDASFRYIWIYYDSNISTTTFQGWYNVEYDNRNLGTSGSDGKPYFNINGTTIEYSLNDKHSGVTIIAFK